MLGYLEESLDYYREAYRLDPHTGINSDHLGVTLFALGRNEEAFRYLRDSLDLGRTFHQLIFLLNVENGDFLNARMIATHIFDGQELLQYFMPIFEDRNNANERQYLVDRFFMKYDLLGPRQGFVDMGHDPIMLAAMGVFDEATEHFVHGPGWRTHLWSPALAEYRASDAFKDFIRQTKMNAYWRKHGWPDLCRPLGDDDFECD